MFLTCFFFMQRLWRLQKRSTLSANCVWMHPATWPTSGQVKLRLVGITPPARERLWLIFCVWCCSGGSAAAAFKDLSKLSRLFKDQLAYPLIATAREGNAPSQMSHNMLVLTSSSSSALIRENLREVKLLWTLAMLQLLVSLRKILFKSMFNFIKIKM